MDLKFSCEGFLMNQDGCPIEGPIDPEKKLQDAKVLFFLREPNNGEAKDFWMRCSVWCNMGNGRGNAKRYFHVLGTLAAMLVCHKNVDCIDDQARYDALSKCAYINMRPDGGEPSRSKKYGEILKKFNDPSYECPSEYSDCGIIAKKRNEILKHLPKDCYIVAPTDIFEALYNRYKEQFTHEKSSIIQIDGKRPFGMFTFKNGAGNNIKVLEFYHPSARFSVSKIKKNLQ